MEQNQNVKGTKDIFLDEASAFEYVENLMKSIADIFAFSEMRPPVIEHTEVFLRSVGESSDVVRKEMYTFLDKGDRSITLRPEFTAGIMRLIIQNKLYATQDLPIKAYYLGPVFRYERPQLGRYRQFNQFGVECLGGNSYLHDVETIALGYSILVSLGFENVKIKINTLGDEASRNDYREALKAYFAEHLDNMCPDCHTRYEINPLRILDCKVPADQEIVKGAPKMIEYLSIESKQRFENVCEELERLEIPFEIDDSLVRGLDYYSETVFEFHYTSKKNVDYGAIGGGGRYDKLMENMGGPSLSGVGFSFGLERVISVMKDDGLLEDKKAGIVDIYMMPLTEDARNIALETALTLRMEGYRVETNHETLKAGTLMKKALRKEALLAIIIGEDELAKGIYTVRDLRNNSQEEVEPANLLDYIDDLLMEDEHHHEHDEHCDCGCH